MKQRNSETDDSINLIKGWNEIEVDIDTLKKWNQIKITKDDIEKALKAKKALKEGIKGMKRFSFY